MLHTALLYGVFLLATAFAVAQQTATITIEVSKKEAPVSAFTARNFF